MEIDIVGEDQVTQAIIERLLTEYRQDIIIKNRLPARGGQIQKMAPIYNRLDSPIFLLTDLDSYPCPPALIASWFGEENISENFIFRIAQEEAETWLMADRQGFSKWLHVDVSLIPEPTIVDRKKKTTEIIFPIKPSLFLMLNIASQSKNKKLKEDLMPLSGARKGPAYNSAIIPYIENIWNVENASTNSFSLTKAIERLQNF
ncbi:MAG: hypothetical protein WBP41_16125 [Saprospiraceae bacterium]